MKNAKKGTALVAQPFMSSDIFVGSAELTVNQTQNLFALERNIVVFVFLYDLFDLFAENFDVG